MRGTNQTMPPRKVGLPPAPFQLHVSTLASAPRGGLAHLVSLAPPWCPQMAEPAAGGVLGWLQEASGMRSWTRLWAWQIPNCQLWADPHPEGNAAPPGGRDSGQEASLPPRGEHRHAPTSQTAAPAHVNTGSGPGEKPMAKGLLRVLGVVQAGRQAVCPESPQVLYPDGLARGVHTRAGVHVRRCVPA